MIRDIEKVVLLDLPVPHMLFDFLTDFFHIWLEIFQQNALTIEKSPKSTIRVKYGEVTFENHPVECRDYFQDAVLVYTLKCIHRGLS